MLYMSRFTKRNHLTLVYTYIDTPVNMETNRRVTLVCDKNAMNRFNSIYIWCARTLANDISSFCVIVSAHRCTKFSWKWDKHAHFMDQMIRVRGTWAWACTDSFYMFVFQCFLVNECVWVCVIHSLLMLNTRKC